MEWGHLLGAPIRYIWGLYKRFFHALGRQIWWILLFAGIGYFQLFLWVPFVMVFLDTQGIYYSDYTWSLMIMPVVIICMCGGGFFGYKFGERRDR